jgi:subtilisin family serine protease
MDMTLRAARRLRLADPPFAGRTGNGVRIAVVDSGLAPGHPHVGGPLGAGVSLVGDPSDTTDRVGHGTAVAAAIREKAPGAELVPVRVFGRDLATDASMLVRAIRWAADHDCALVNLSLGTPNRAHEATLLDAVRHANEAQCLVVAAFAVDGVPHFPGSLQDVLVVGVEAAPGFERDEIEFFPVQGGARMNCRASILPRPIPGVPPERNLRGVSFSVANVAGFLALRLERDAWPTLLEGLHP